MLRMFAWASTASADDPIQTPYQEFATLNCTFAGDCAIVFSKVAQRTLVMRASCNFALTHGSTISFATLGIQNENPRDQLQVFDYGTNNGLDLYGINADTYLFISDGEQPRIDVFGSSAVQSLLCTISGYHIS